MKNSHANEDLNSLRTLIDETDKSLLSLFEKRMALVKKVGLYKKEHDLPVFNEDREKEILSSKIKLLENLEFENETIEFFNHLFSISRKYQDKLINSPVNDSPSNLRNFKKNIVLIGMMGSGKSSIGKILAEKLNYDFVDVDEYIESTENMSISDIFSVRGENAFRQKESLAIKELCKRSKAVIATGGGAILDPRNITALKKTGVIVFIDRPLDEIVEMIETENRPLLANGKEILHNIHAERLPLYQSACDLTVVNNAAIDDAVDEIISIL